MACGTGKSLTAIWINDLLKAQKIAIVIPTLLLESQTVGVWLEAFKYSTQRFAYLVIGSDKSITTLHGVTTTTDETEIIDFIQANTRKPFVIFTTYYSSPRLVSALGKTRNKLDLCCFDEAHNTAGGEKNANALLNGTDALIQKKLFMTATEKFFTGNNFDRVFSMNDETLYGKRFYHLPTHTAIERNILCDYKIITLYTTKDEIIDWIKNNVVLTDENRFSDESIGYVSTAVSICKMIVKYDLKKIISYHSSVAGAKRFLELLEIVAALFSLNIETFHVNHTQNQRQKEDVFKGFSTAELSVLSNSRAINEGYDLPAIDSIVFADERSSVIDITQAIGRALRKSPHKQFAYIMLPIMHDDDEYNHFEVVRKTLAAIATTDERIADYFSKKERGRKPTENMMIHEKITKNIDLTAFSEAVSIKVWQRTAHLYYRTFEEAKAWVKENNLSEYGIIDSERWREYIKGEYQEAPSLPPDIPNRPEHPYRNDGWKDYRDFLGTTPWPYDKAKKWCHDHLPMNIGYSDFLRKFRANELPPQIMSPNFYGKDWKGYKDFLPRNRIPYSEAKQWIQNNLFPVINSQAKYRKYLKGNYPELPPLPEGMLKTPNKYKEFEGWTVLFDKKK